MRGIGRGIEHARRCDDLIACDIDVLYTLEFELEAILAKEIQVRTLDDDYSLVVEDVPNGVLDVMGSVGVCPIEASHRVVSQCD